MVDDTIAKRLVLERKIILKSSGFGFVGKN